MEAEIKSLATVGYLRILVIAIILYSTFLISFVLQNMKQTFILFEIRLAQT